MKHSVFTPRLLLLLSLGVLLGQDSCKAASLDAQNKPAEDVLLLRNQTTRGLLFFLDDSEAARQARGAMTVTLSLALTQQAGPMIATGSLVHHVLKYVQFDPTAWVIKQIDHSKYMDRNLLLLIPKKWFAEQGINYQTTAKVAEQVITPLEYQVGLKLDHMTDVTFNAAAKAPLKQLVNRPWPLTKQRWHLDKSSKHYFPPLLYDQKRKNSKIFVLKSEYLVSKQADLEPQWVIYIVGHGLIDHSIVDLSLAEFKEVLAFLDRKISTGIFIYDSCYSAGVNTERIFHGKGVEDDYSFALVTCALTDSVVWVDGSPRFDRFMQFANLKKQGLDSNSRMTVRLDYKKLVRTVVPARAEFVNNQPHIKFPLVPGFWPVEKTSLVTISKTTAATHSPQQPLNVRELMAKQGVAKPNALLLCATEMPFEIELSNTDCPIISVIPGAATHQIRKLSSKTATFTQIFKRFMRVPNVGYDPRKVFYVREISALADNCTSGTIKNVVIDLNEDPKVAYTYQGEYYEIYFQHSPRDLQVYQRDFRQCQYNIYAPYQDLIGCYIFEVFTQALNALCRDTLKHTSQVSNLMAQLPNRSVYVTEQLCTEHSSNWLLQALAEQLSKTAKPPVKVLMAERVLTAGGAEQLTNLVADAANRVIYFTAADGQCCKAVLNGKQRLEITNTNAYHDHYQQLQQRFMTEGVINKVVANETGVSNAANHQHWNPDFIQQLEEIFKNKPHRCAFGLASTQLYRQQHSTKNFPVLYALLTV